MHISRIGLVVLVSAGALSCSPGELECPGVDCPQGAGDAGGGGGAPEPVVNPMAISATTPVGGGCKYTTVGEVEAKLIKPSCGSEVACHATKGAYPPDLQAPDAFLRLLDVKATWPGNPDCRGKVSYVDAANPEGSYLISKVKDYQPSCQGKTAAAGLRMPYGTYALMGADVDCFMAYARAISAR